MDAALGITHHPGTAGEAGAGALAVAAAEACKEGGISSVWGATSGRDGADSISATAHSLCPLLGLLYGSLSYGPQARTR